MSVARKAGLGATAATLAALLSGHWEGMNLVAEHLPFDPAGVTTVCGGITNYDWPWLKPGMKFSRAKCTEELAKLAPRYAAPLQACMPGFNEFPPHRQAALISLAVNIGPGRVCKGHYDKAGVYHPSIADYLNKGRVEAGCNAITQYTRAAGKVLKGLVNRRTDRTWGERTWCLRED